MRKITGIRSAFLLTAIYASPAVQHVAAAEDSVKEPSRSHQTFEGGFPDALEVSLNAAGRLTATALDVSDVRFDKVADLRMRIADGSYFVSPAEVAGRMIDSLLG